MTVIVFKEFPNIPMCFLMRLFPGSPRPSRRPPPTDGAAGGLQEHNAGLREFLAFPKFPKFPKFPMTVNVFKEFPNIPMCF